MPHMRIMLNGDNVWPDLKDKLDDVINVENIDAVTVLGGSMVSGMASVAFRIELPDGKTVIAQTSLALFLTAARAFHAKYPDALV